MSDAIWRRSFRADPAIVGQTVTVNNVDLTVVGVAEPSFHGAVVGIDIELFVPVKMQPLLSGGWNALDQPDAQVLFGLVRPRVGISTDQVRAEVGRVSAGLDIERPSTTLSERALAMPIQESPQGLQTYGGPLVSLMGGVAGLLLVVVCANVAGLVLVRTVGRRAEIGARLALGATRARICRLLLFEALILAVPGAGLGWWLRQFADPYVTSAKSALSVPLYVETNGAAVTVVALLLALVSALLCGLLPGLTASRIDLSSTMKDSPSLPGRSTTRLRALLVIGQVATAVVLLVGTALVVRSVDAARQASPGFDPRHVATILLDVGPAGYHAGDGFRFYERLQDGLRRMEGVESVSLMRTPLLMIWDFGGREFSVEGHPGGPGDDREFGFNIVAPGHFHTLRIPLLAGRDFSSDESAARVAIVNETLARRFWGGPEGAIGRQLGTAEWTTGVPTTMTVIGVARDIKYVRLNEEPRPYVYLPFSQAYGPMMAVHVRARLAAPDLVDRVRRYIATTDPNVPILESRMLVEQTNLGLAIHVVAARMLTIVGLAAIVLAALGIYGLVAYTVKQSAREIGIRLAIGASRGRIFNRYLSRGLCLGVIGAAVGIGGAVGASRLLASLLLGITPTDVASFAAATALVLITAGAASIVPAWRASRSDPVIALRQQ
jgi:predicted permease